MFKADGGETERREGFESLEALAAKKAEGSACRRGRVW